MTVRLLSGLILSILTLLGPPSWASTGVQDDSIAVVLGQTPVRIDFSTLLANDSAAGTVSLARPSVFGDVSVGADHFVYTPSDDFWGVELDSFLYRVEGLSGVVFEGTVGLFAERLDEAEDHRERFESSFDLASYPQSISGAGHSLSLKSEAQLEGAYGLEVAVDGGHAYLTMDGPGYEGVGNESSGSASTEMGCLLDPLYEHRMVVLAVGGNPTRFAPDPPTLRVVTDPGGLVLQGHTATGYVESKALPLSGDRAFVELEWRPRDSGVFDVLLRVDGLATTLEVPVIAADFSKVHLGLVPVDGEGPTTLLAFDDVRLFRASTAGPEPIHSMHGFESGDPGYRTSTVGTGLRVTSDAALSGSFGLQADATTGSYILEDSPEATRSLGTQMRLDLSQLTMTYGDSATFYSFGHIPTANLNTDTELRMRFYAGPSHDLRLLTTFVRSTQGGGVRWSPTIPLVRGENHLTLQYRTASSAIHPNGYLRVWLDGEPVIELMDLDSVGKEAEWFHLGFYGPDPGTSGVVFLDDFLSTGR